MPRTPDYDPTDPAWLAANRRGALAPAQRALLREEVVGSTGGFLYSLITTVPIVLLVGMGVGAALAGLVTSAASGLEVGAGLGVLAGLIVLIGRRMTGAPDLAAWRDLQAGRVLTAPGTIERAGTGYRPRLDGHAAAFLDLTWTDYLTTRSLRPGAYTFYYLPYSRRIVAAEPQRLAPWPDTHAALGAALAAAFEFAPADLALNDQGRLAPDQQRRLIRLALARLVMSAGAAALIAMLLGEGLAADWGGWLILALMTITTGWLLWRAGLMLADLRAGGVVAISGAVNKGYRRGSVNGGTLPEFSWTVAGYPPFGVPNVAYGALIAGEHYRVYFAPRSRVIVAVEPLPDAPPRGPGYSHATPADLQ